jgi:DNA-binding response OmpR family regulator
LPADLPGRLSGALSRCAVGPWEGDPVPDPRQRRSRVLIADLDPMARVGMAGMLAEHGAEVVDESAGADLVDAVRRLRPDAVVLDLDGGASHDLGARVRQACPSTKVVLWARGEDVIEVLDPGASDPRFVLGGDPDELRAELVTAPTTSAEDDDSCPRT